MADWAGERFGLAFVLSGERWRDGCVVSFMGRGRGECFIIDIVSSLARARVVISGWEGDDNRRRRHSSLGYRTPAVYAAAVTHR